MEDWKNIVENEAKLRGYSKKTITSYLYQINKFLQSRKNPREYLLELIDSKKSNESVRAAGFAIKFYLNCCCKQKFDVNEIVKDIPNVKREKKLPVVLAKEDIEQ